MVVGFTSTYANRLAYGIRRRGPLAWHNAEDFVRLMLLVRIPIKGRPEIPWYDSYAHEFNCPGKLTMPRHDKSLIIYYFISVLNSSFPLV